MRRVTIWILWLLTSCVALFSQNYPGHWKGKWIWISGEAHPINFFLMARRSFELQAMPRAGRLLITAGDRYMLYVNGQYLGRGPARSDARWTSYDTYELGPELRVGRNTIAVLAYHYGVANSYSRDERSGLFVQMELTSSDGAKSVIGSGRDWRVRQARGWKQAGKPPNSEIYDSNADPANWNDPGLDDSTWEQAYEIPSTDTPWSYLEPRQTPPLLEEETFPQKVFEAGEVMELGHRLGEARIAERLALEPHFPLEFTRLEQPDAVLKHDGNPAIIQSAPYKLGERIRKGVRSPYLILDFGRPIFGFPLVRLKGPAQGIVEMTYDVNLINGRPLQLLGGVRYGDRYTMREGEQTWRVFEYKVFRYLLIVFRNVDVPVSVDSISVLAYNYPAKRKGSFECSDPVLTKLWKASVDTTYLHMEDTLVCDAVRERLAWIGDGAHGLYGIYAGYGDIALTDWFFRLLKRGALADGMLRIYYPGSEPPVGGRPRSPGRSSTAYENPQNIPQFALFYGMFVAEHYRYFGKKKLLEELYPALVGVAEWCERHSDDTGLLYSLSNLSFVDWVPTEMNGANFETNALYYNLLEDMSELATELGKPRDSERWKLGAARIRSSLQKLHWNPQRDLFVDSVIDGKQSPILTELSNGMALLFGIATPAQASKIVRNLTNPPGDLFLSTPLYFHYVLEGLIKSGASAAALQFMRDRYEQMMSVSDVPTMLEFWSPYVRAWTPSGQISDLKSGYSGQVTSPAHSGSVGPAWTLSKHVLGVYPIGPGFQKCRIGPELGHLQWARGVFPSIRGDISVRWDHKPDRFTLEVSVPTGLETDLTLPHGSYREGQLVHNGKQYDLARAKLPKDIVVADGRIVVKVVGGGHRLELLGPPR
ncbi:MAG: glycoside hydrolase family 78 protein [Acidobacteria bacterium]|nr:glycoside hydrolase family 78 protein [Acidobacteriota bacterium]MCI0719432.1 glycoside hydrolase family 78 protein [Acidobacteriota bacterium]